MPRVTTCHSHASEQVSALNKDITAHKGRYDALRDEHAPCAFAIKARDDEIDRLAAEKKLLESRLAKAVEEREDETAGLQQQLKSMQAKLEALREEHAPCAAALGARSAEVSKLSKDLASAEQALSARDLEIGVCVCVCACVCVCVRARACACVCMCVCLCASLESESNRSRAFECQQQQPMFIGTQIMYPLLPVSTGSSKQYRCHQGYDRAVASQEGGDFV